MSGLGGAIAAKTVTYDLERHVQGTIEVRTSMLPKATAEHLERAVMKCEEGKKLECHGAA